MLGDDDARACALNGRRGVIAFRREELVQTDEPVAVLHSNGLKVSTVEYLFAVRVLPRASVASVPPTTPKSAVRVTC